MWQQTELLILVKTYPSPSTKYRETTCVAAVNREGQLRRIFPVPFRFLGGNSQFRKWEWIQARVQRAVGDRRPESYRIDVDSIILSGSIVPTDHGWAERRRWIDPHICEGFVELEDRRQRTGETLGVIRPARLLGLDITPVNNPEWTDEEWTKLHREGLFDAPDSQQRPPLRKLGHTFHYRYECDGSEGPVPQRHMITDWEAGALYWNCRRKHGAQWEGPFRQRLEAEFAQRELLFLMGTIHQRPYQWLIVGLIYPPRLPATQQVLDL